MVPQDRCATAKRQAIPAGAVASALVLAACTPIVPPPLMARHHGPGRDEKGTFSVTVAAGIGASATAGGLGFELRARWQAYDDVAFGLGLGMAYGDADPAETVGDVKIFALRAFTAANPFPTDDVGFTAGAGLSTMNTGLFAFSLDAGAVVGATIADTIEPSLGLSGAVAIPIAQGRPFGARAEPLLPTTTFYYGGSLDLAVHLGSTRNVLAAEAGAFGARSISGEQNTALYLSAADTQGVRP